MTLEVLSLGCRLNLAESEQLRDMLRGNDNLVVVNSCAVTAQAARQTRQTIRRARRLHPGARLLVTGCGAEIERGSLAAMPEIDGIIANAAKLDPRAWNVAAPAVSAPPDRTRHSRGFVQVQNGCDHACTFCAIPQGRGPGRSHAEAAVIADIERHVAAGAGEVVLTGVDLTSWGTDLPGTPRLGGLVTAILRAVPQLPRLRLSSIDGAEIDPELFELLAGNERLMPHVHLSLQSGDDMILKRMKRRHSRADVVALVDGLRARRADLAVGADLIAGFPTEDDAMHTASLSIIARLGVVHGHIFPYSPRPGTPAARMPRVDPAVVRARAAALRAAVAAQRGDWLADKIGRPLEVLAENDGTGHARDFAPVRLPLGTAPGTIIAFTPERIAEGMLA